MDNNYQDQNKDLEEEFGNGSNLSITRVSGMYEDYFLDYASYVILERAVPKIGDGLKPVQRRIMHAMREMDDGRFHKVANIIGQTMKYHPHGDASIGDALVQLGQKNILIETQGNWGNVLTGDSAAAPRYIEARLSKFALEVIFNPKVTEWQTSYDGRGKEPVELPAKFPLLLAQGVEGIAVGLSTRILPHNFNELIDASIKVLRGRNFEIYPDFPSGGIADFTQYQNGKRGGRVRIRAKINVQDKKTLIIDEIPFGTTTTSLIDSVLKANDKGKIKIKRIEDNTAEHVEIKITLPAAVSPDKTIDALYAFTDCETSVSPLACTIQEDKPHFLDVKEILRRNTQNTLNILKAEQEYELNHLQEQWHFASLERIFIEHKIYRKIEEAESWEEVLDFIRKGLQPHLKILLRPVTDEDIVRLTEIKIKRISKYDKSKADDHIANLEDKIAQVKHNLAHLTDFAVDWLKNLKKKYGKGRDRKTEIRVFEDIVASKVALANEKLYANFEEGFVGTSLKKDTFITECSDIADLIVFLNNGQMMVTRVGPKTYVGKNIIHVAVWKKGDKRTTYNMLYRDGTKGATYMKRFQVNSITRDKLYDLTRGTAGTKVLHFTANPNGEAEKLTVYLRALQRLKKLRIDLDLADLAIKGRAAKGNLVTKHPVKKIEIKEEGVSTLEARKIWFDETVQRLNAEGRGTLLGSFKGQDKLLEISKTGHYRLLGYDLSTHFDEHMIHLQKLDPNRAVSAIYYDGEKERHYVKRFIPELTDRKEPFITDHPRSKLEWISTANHPQVEIVFKKVKGRQPENEIINIADFIAIKGEKAQGNQLHKEPVKQIKGLEPLVKSTAKSTTEEETQGPTDANAEPTKKDDSEGPAQISIDF
jgi:topoisomerase-4 subunit A